MELVIYDIVVDIVLDIALEISLSLSESNTDNTNRNSPARSVKVIESVVKHELDEQVFEVATTLSLVKFTMSNSAMIGIIIFMINSFFIRLE